MSEALTETTVISRTPEAIEGNLPEETVLLHVGTGKAVRVNGTGAWIWAGIEEPAEIAALAGKLAEAHGIEPERALTDVLAFAGDLVSRGLIQASPV